ncbi:MAG TPA: pentapeptide repeat-containing protein [Mycobacteriales bacterium]|nr:pentapeptide repeat-containing protein [Mycobacteriales bacterium]
MSGSGADAAPCGKAHRPIAPNLSGAEPATTFAGDCDEDVSDLWLAGARVLELSLDRPELVDLRLDGCDLSGIVARDFIARRLALTDTRLRGVTFANGLLEETVVEGGVTDELSLRFSRLRRVTFRDCDLSGADFTNTTFEHVSITGCSMRRARFDAATVECLVISDCDLGGVTGALHLKGAQIDASDLPSLAISLAREAGIAIRDQ